MDDDVEGCRVSPIFWLGSAENPGFSSLLMASSSPVDLMFSDYGANLEKRARFASAMYELEQSRATTVGAKAATSNL